MYRSIFYMFLFIFCLAGLNSTAQDLTKLATTPITDNFAGRPVDVNKYSKIKGSPYIYDDWLQGEVITNDGKVYKKMLIKFNAEKDELTFVYNKTDEPQKFAEPIRMFTIHAEQDRVFANQFPKIDGQNDASYYEVLLPGKAMLLIRHKEVMQTGINDVTRASTDGVYANQNIYYVYKDNQMQHLKATRNGVLKLLADKAAEVTAYADSQKINFEQEEDIKKLLNYYNTLQ